MRKRIDSRERRMRKMKEKNPIRKWPEKRRSHTAQVTGEQTTSPEKRCYGMALIPF